MTEVSREGAYVGWRVSTGYNQQTVLSRPDGVTAHGVEGISVHGCSLDTCRRDVLPMFGCTSHTTTPMYTNTADKPQPIVSGVSGQAHGHKTPRYRADVKNPLSKPRKLVHPPLKYQWQAYGTVMSETDLETMLAGCAEASCGRGQLFKPFTRPLQYKVRRNGTSVCELFCPFNHQSACTFKARIIRTPASMGYTYLLEVGDHLHNDHQPILNRRNAVQRHTLDRGIKGWMNSPTKQHTGPRQIVHALHQHGYCLQRRDIENVKSQFYRMKR
jgi:hypothetical protein